MPGAPNRVPDPTAAAIAIESALSAQRPKSLSRVGTVVEFRAGVLRFVTNMNVLVPISSGHIHVQSDLSGLRILYTIRFTEILIFSLMVNAVFAFAVTSRAVGPTSALGVIIIFLPFIWLFGGNVAITLFRFPRLLRRAAGTGNAV